MSVTVLVFLSLIPYKVDAGSVNGHEDYDLGYLCGDSFARKLGLTNFNQNFSSRGIIRPIGSNMTSDESIQMGMAGAISWNMRVEFVRTEQEARARIQVFRKKNKGSLTWPIFIIADELPILEQGQAFDIDAFFEKHESAKVLTIEPNYESPTGHDILKIYPNQAIIRSYWSEVTWNVIESYLKDGQLALLSSGVWSAPKVRGVILLKDWDDSNTITKIRGLSDILRKKSYRIEFNRNNEEALRLLVEQTRRNKSAAENRYANEVIFNEAKQRLKDGTAFEASLVDSEGKVKAGILFYLSAGIVAAETVFYPPPVDMNGNLNRYGHGMKPIDLAKVAAVAAGDRLREKGVTFIDAQTVSEFSTLLKAHYIPTQMFFDLVRQEQSRLIDLSSFLKPE